jgi:hypothetical protein
VNSGTLVVNGSISAASTMTVNAGTLSGTGMTSPVIVAGGTIAPGVGPGILNTRNLIFNGGSLSLEILGNTPGDGMTGYDQLNVTGTGALNSPVALLLDFSLYDPVDSADSFVVLKNDLADPVTFGSAGARFTYNGMALNEGATFTASGIFNQDFRITYAGGDGNDVVLFAVPEPGTAANVAASLMGLLGLQRFRRRASNPV